MLFYIANKKPNFIVTCINSGGAIKYQNLHYFQRYAFANENSLIFIAVLLYCHLLLEFSCG